MFSIIDRYVFLKIKKINDKKSKDYNLCQNEEERKYEEEEASFIDWQTDIVLTSENHGHGQK